MSETTPPTPGEAPASVSPTTPATATTPVHSIKLMLLGLLLFLVGVNLLPLLNEVLLFIAPYIAPPIALNSPSFAIPVAILSIIIAIAGVVVALIGFFSREKSA